MENIQRLPAPIKIDPRKISDVEYWSTVCGSCRTTEIDSNGSNYNLVKIGRRILQVPVEDISEQCAGCMCMLSEIKKEGKPFYLV